MIEVWTITGLYSLAAILPIWGLVSFTTGLSERKRAVREGSREIHRLHALKLDALESKQEDIYSAQIAAVFDRLDLPQSTYSDVYGLHVTIADVWMSMTWRGAVFQLCLVSSGLVAGAIASIWSLFI